MWIYNLITFFLRIVTKFEDGKSKGHQITFLVEIFALSIKNWTSSFVVYHSSSILYWKGKFIFINNHN